MNRSMLFYVSNLLLVFYLIFAIYSIMINNRNKRLVFGTVSALFFGLAMSIILFWLPSHADPSTIKKSIHSLLLMGVLILPFLFSWKWKLDVKMKAMLEKKKKRH